MKDISTASVPLYLFLAFALSWLLWIVAYLLFKVFRLIDIMGFMGASYLPMCGPAIAVLAVSLRRGKRTSVGQRAKRAWRAALGYGFIGSLSVAAALLLSAVCLGALLRSAFGLEVVWETWKKFLILWLMAIPFWIPLVSLEELGWRGFLFKAWSGEGKVKSVFLLGFVWALWHLPTFFFLGC